MMNFLIFTINDKNHPYLLDIQANGTTMKSCCLKTCSCMTDCVIYCVIQLQVGRVFTQMLKLPICEKYSCKDTFTFVNEIHKVGN